MRGGGNFDALRIRYIFFGMRMEREQTIDTKVYVTKPPKICHIASELYLDFHPITCKRKKLHFSPKNRIPILQGALSYFDAPSLLLVLICNICCTRPAPCLSILESLILNIANLNAHPSGLPDLPPSTAHYSFNPLLHISSTEDSK